MKELFRMIWNRIIGNKPIGEYRYIKIIQNDGLEYMVKIHKDNYLNELIQYVNNPYIKFIEITEYDYLHYV